MLLKGLVILWCGLQFLEFILSLFFSSRIQGFLFAISNCTDGFMHLSKQEMKRETNFITIAAWLRLVALKWCMTYLHISTGSLFIHFGIRVLVSSIMVFSRMYLCEGDIQQRLLDELTDSDQSSLTEDLTVNEVIGAECSDNENDKVQFATASSAPSASSAFIALPCIQWVQGLFPRGKAASTLLVPLTSWSSHLGCFTHGCTSLPVVMRHEAG
jgi:hypothetical protein